MWIPWKCLVDSGASFMMTTNSQMLQLGLPSADCVQKYTATLPMIFPPAKQQGNMPLGVRDYGQQGFSPTPSTMTDAVRTAITKDYTILIANDLQGKQSAGENG